MTTAAWSFACRLLLSVEHGQMGVEVVVSRGDPGPVTVEARGEDGRGRWRTVRAGEFMPLDPGRWRLSASQAGQVGCVTEIEVPA